MLCLEALTVNIIYSAKMDKMDFGSLDWFMPVVLTRYLVRANNKYLVP
jgi:hypothetical protein